MADTNRHKAERAAKAAVAASYTEEDVTRGLVALVWCQGSATRARATLIESFGSSPPAATLNGWKDRAHAERYATLRHEAQQELEQEAIRRMRDTMALAATAETLALEATIAGLKNKSLDRPDQVANNMAKVKATNAEKLMTMTGRPASITENRSVDQLLKVLAANNVLQLPEPIVDAEVIE